MEKFTKKKEPKSAGLAGMFQSDCWELKLGGSIVGSIRPDFRIMLMVMKTPDQPDENPNCPWKWIVLAVKPNSLNDAMEFLSINQKRITSKYTLRKLS